MANSPRYTREIPHRYRLEAQKFEKSGHVAFPRRYVDPTNGDRKSEPITLSGFGTILSYTSINIAADDYARQTPFAIAIIETEEGARLTTQVIDCDYKDVKIGARVQLVFRKIMEEGASGIINYGYKAILV
ncbi:MAG: Zn-ribbon domain-containing OB-fold protein [Candidatus Kapabacteria bacterium]|nr:Zn-ribbon domain-containing OB-fold protein [Candidatus Kapabacteria bacterium]